MGITSFKPFLKKKVPQAFGLCPLTFFKYKRVAIDFSCIMYANMAIAKKQCVSETNLMFQDLDTKRMEKNWIGMCINKLIMFLKHEIIPICVFDGPPLDDKMETIEARNLVRMTNRENAKKEIEKIRSIPSGSLTPESIVSQLSYSETDASKIVGRYLDLPFELRDKLYNLFKSIGVPTVRATHDGEKTCVALCNFGFADFVYSADIDTLPYGAEFSVYKISEENYDGNRCQICEYIHLPTLLNGLNLTHDQLIDICIMSGCDFNKNIKNVGPARSYDKIYTFGNIETSLSNMNVTLEDVENLRYQRCREIFKIDNLKSVVKDNPRYIIDYVLVNTVLPAFLDNEGQSQYISNLQALLNCVQPTIVFD